MSGSDTWALGLMVLATVFLGGCGTSTSSSAERVARVGYLAPSSSQPGQTPYYDALRDELRRLGYMEDRTITYLYEPVGPHDDAAAAAARLMAREPDVVVASTWPLVQAASVARSTTPIVMITSVDPLSTGLVNTLRRPGGNVSGLTVGVSLGAKRLELLLGVAPAVSHVAVLARGNSASNRADWEGIQQAAAILGVTVELVAAGDAASLTEALRSVEQSGAEALIVCGDALFMERQAEIIAFAAEHHLPAIYASRQYVLAGGLLGYGPSLADMYRRSAYYVHRVLSGARLADLPVEMPARYELAVNSSTAQALGLSLPRTTLVYATEIVH